MFSSAARNGASSVIAAVRTSSCPPRLMICAFCPCGFPASSASAFCFASPKRVLARMLKEWSSRSEEHTSELQSQSNLVCRLLLEKKKKSKPIIHEGREIRTDNVTDL